MEDKDNDAESLELDKLEVHAKAKQTEQTPPSSETQGTKAVSDTKRAALWNSLIALVRDKVFVLAKDKVFILSLLAGILAGSLVLFYPALQKFLSKGGGYDRDSASRITYRVSCLIGDDHHVRFKLYVPFRDEEEKRHLMRNLPKIKDELRICGTLPKVAGYIQKKDLDNLKTEIINIVNNLTGVPVEELDLKDLSLK